MKQTLVPGLVTRTKSRLHVAPLHRCTFDLWEKEGGCDLREGAFTIVGKGHVVEHTTHVKVHVVGKRRRERIVCEEKIHI